MGKQQDPHDQGRQEPQEPQDDDYRPPDPGVEWEKRDGGTPDVELRDKRR